jgi:hypothetical protein
MQMEAFLWLFLPVFVAGGSALLSYYVMQARMEVAIAKERETLAEARAMLSSHKITLEERVKATEEACKRQAMDDFMHDIRIEERSYVRETKSLNASRKTMVMQERVFFRNIPLSNWIDREMLIEDGQNPDPLPMASVYTTASLPKPLTASLPATAETPMAIARLLHEVKTARPEFRNDIRPAVPEDVPEETRPTVLLTQHATAFGAQ